VLFSLPSTDLVLRHVIEEAVSVVNPEPSGGEPPLDRPPDRSATAPALGITAALTIPRIVDALNESPSQPNEVSARTEHTRHSPNPDILIRDPGPEPDPDSDRPGGGQRFCQAVGDASVQCGPLLLGIDLDSCVCPNE
jgi:hypothetical protein